MGASDRARIARALATLPEIQRRTLEVAFFEGLPYREIADREGVAVGPAPGARARSGRREPLGALMVGDFFPRNLKNPVALGEPISIFSMNP